jgi:hypothetical protein
VGSDGQTTNHLKRSNHTAARAGPRRARKHIMCLSRASAKRLVYCPGAGEEIGRNRRVFGLGLDLLRPSRGARTAALRHCLPGRSTRASDESNSRPRASNAVEVCLADPEVVRSDRDSDLGCSGHDKPCIAGSAPASHAPIRTLWIPFNVDAGVRSTAPAGNFRAQISCPIALRWTSFLQARSPMSPRASGLKHVRRCQHRRISKAPADNLKPDR